MATALNQVWGSPLPLVGGDEAAGTTALQGNNTKFAAVLGVDCDEATVVITHLGYRQTAMTGTPGANSYQIGLQGVGTDGLPNGTILGGGSPNSATITPGAGDTNNWKWVALANSYTASRGQLASGLVAIVLEHIVSDTSNYITVQTGAAAASADRTGVPYWLTHNGTSYTKGATNNYPCIGFKNTDASIVGARPLKTYTSATFGATVESGFAFNIPTNICSTYKVKGVRVRSTLPTTGAGTYQARLYATPTGTPSVQQQTGAIDNDVVASSAGASRILELFFPEASLVELSAGTQYAIALSTTTAAAMNLLYVEQAAAADFNAWPYRQATSFITRTNASYPPAASATAFTETTTRRPMMELILADLTAPAGGGGTTIAGTTLQRGMVG